ncbi:MAG: nucleoside-diphosphate kinase [Thermoplasmata archaeon]|nr:nucleoside-diphosphate kinase [Thermoplasmata archaeon]MVT13759.1 nucleoside-diphosphate kinase [Euryarchaeota archaeon]MVT14602.1 nucleoside-diphosphate kinase [Euryarchaeota archaeon]MVT35587.1 nucleoside-diphosphate kinase [Euryarchaeota archaeon]
MNRTLVIIKPDAVQRAFAGRIITRIEEKGLKIVAMKMVQLDRKTAERLYEVHKGKSFYESLIDYITSGPIVAMVVEGRDAINVVRKLMGKTNGAEAEPGTIRGDFSTGVEKNLVHGSDSEESFNREFPVLFNKEEIISYRRIDEEWI